MTWNRFLLLFYGHFCIIASIEHTNLVVFSSFFLSLFVWEEKYSFWFKLFLSFPNNQKQIDRIWFRFVFVFQFLFWAGCVEIVMFSPMFSEKKQRKTFNVYRLVECFDFLFDTSNHHYHHQSLFKTEQKKKFTEV